MFAGTCTDMPAGTTLTPAAGGSCFNLQVNNAVDTSLWQ